jgi:TorA maturation chaperone TorD
MVTVPRLNAKTARQQSALDEAEQVADWADRSTPEWVRCLGAIWEAFESEALQADYRAHVTEMVNTDKKAPPWISNDPQKMRSRRIDDLEVVIRQLRERDYFRAADVAAQIGVEVFPNESWVHSAAANCARQAGDPRRGAELDRRCAELLEGTPEAASAWKRYANALGLLRPAADPALMAFALEKISGPGGGEVTAHDLTARLLEIKTTAQGDPDAALALGLALHAELAADKLAEDAAGHGLVEFLLDVLLARNDLRAITIAQSLLDAKLALWGESPAAWLERHNLGGTYAQLGQVAKGKELVTAARDALLAMFGANNPHVQMCERTLGRIARMPT